MPDKQEISRDEKGRWKSGTSGNPDGRPPKKLCIPEILKDLGQEEVDDNCRLEMVLRKVYDMAIKGNMRAVEFIAERLEGRPTLGEKPFVNDDMAEGFDVQVIDSKGNVIDGCTHEKE